MINSSLYKFFRRAREICLTAQVHTTLSQRLNTLQVFSITVSGPGGYSSTQTVDDGGGSFTLGDLAAGSYTMGESNPGAGWEAPTLTPANVTVNVGTTATATVANKHRAYSKLQLTTR